MSNFRFEVGQEVLRIDLHGSGKTWGKPVVITNRKILNLPAHKISENRYTFTEGQFEYEYPEYALTKDDLSDPNEHLVLYKKKQMIIRNQFLKKKSKLSWFNWLFTEEKK